MNVFSSVSLAISSCSHVMSGFMDLSLAMLASTRFFMFMALVWATRSSPLDFNCAALYAPIQKTARMGTESARPTTKPAQKKIALITVSAYTHGVIISRA